MGVYRIRKGLDVPISGAPRAGVIEPGPKVRQVGLLGDDYVGMRPTMEVSAGDKVRLGQTLFTDKKTEGVRFTSPAGGRVAAVNRGAKRRFESLVIDVAGNEDPVPFATYKSSELGGLDPQKIRDNLVESGLWTSFRTRPFSRIPALDATPDAIFVAAIDTHPLSADPAVIIAEKTDAFSNGLRLVSRLCEGVTHVCTGNDPSVPGADIERVQISQFIGPHPAGLPGTHMHFIYPVSRQQTAWSIGYQDVIAIGELFRTGVLPTERVLSIAGPAMREPRVVRSRIGASLGDLTAGQISREPARLISGSVLGGRTGDGVKGYLGRYHNQVTVLPEARDREFLGWQKPGFDKFSVVRAFLSALRGKGARYEMTTSTNGSPRAMVPIGMYERVMPLNMLPTFLLRSLVVKDTEQAQALGCLELDEEDLALCTFVCPGKTEYGPILRDNLSLIEKEG